MLSLEPTSGWALARHAMAYVARASNVEQVEAVVTEARQRGLSIIPRGAGFSYGDEILNSNRIVLDVRGMSRILNWDPASGVMKVEPGVTFGQALSRCLPDNWVVAAVPGIRGPTLGGALSNNVHGKNAWKDGAFGESVLSFVLLTSDGRIHACSREENSDLFHAAIGGLGLFGVVLEIVLQCKRVPSPYLEVQKWSVPNVDRMIEDFVTIRDKADYHIGWVDCFWKGPQLGRGTVHAAMFVDAPRVPPNGNGLSSTSPYLFGVFPRTWLWPIARPVFGNTFMRTVNIVKFQSDRLGKQRVPYLKNFFEFTFLLDSIPEWRQLYQPHGYLELEAVIPFERCANALREIIRLTHEYGTASFLCGVKSHRRDDFWLSFSADGCSFGIDIPIDPRRRDELTRLFHRMNDVVVRAGGRTYLAKDETISRDHFRGMFPRWKDFDALKRRVDPHLIFQSDMYRRLFAPSA